MTTLEVYDPAMCCSTGVCGPDVDPALVAFAADLKWIGEQGIAVQRYNLGKDAQAFAANSAVVKELQAGTERLPIIVVDSKIVSTGVYLSRSQLAENRASIAGAKRVNASTMVNTRARRFASLTLTGQPSRRSRTCTRRYP